MCAVTVFTDEVGAVHNGQINHPFMKTYVRMSITFCKITQYILIIISTE